MSVSIEFNFEDLRGNINKLSHDFPKMYDCLQDMTGGYLHGKANKKMLRLSQTRYTSYLKREKNKDSNTIKLTKVPTTRHLFGKMAENGKTWLSNMRTKNGKVVVGFLARNAGYSHNLYDRNCKLKETFTSQKNSSVVKYVGEFNEGKDLKTSSKMRGMLYHNKIRVGAVIKRPHYPFLEGVLNESMPYIQQITQKMLDKKGLL